MQPETDLENLTGYEKIMAEARNRFRYCESSEARCRKAFIEDLKFANGDENNGYQWPNDIRRSRDLDERPCLTINKTHQHCLQIINDAKQNKPSVNVRPTGGGASFDSSQILEGAIRRIEYISNASSAYDKATEFQVYAGLGYWRVITDYAADDSFDQEIFIRPVKNPLNVYLDPDISEADGEDARFGFIFDDVPRDKFNSKYPKYKDIAARTALGNNDNWCDKEHIRVAEYYRAIDKSDILVAFTEPGSGKVTILRKKEIPEPLRTMILEDPSTRTRTITQRKIEWYLIVGEEIVEEKEWPGSTIPIVRLPGEEIIIDGELDRKGHTRQLKDPQRIYNYWSSAAVEFVALQGKTPFIAPAKAIEGYETYWHNANKVAHAILPYNNIDDDGNVIPSPVRQAPPTFAPAYMQGMQVAANEMMMVSGQYQAVMGQPGNETSGRAINERQRQGENSTYHFLDNQAKAIRRTGKILIELIPKIYDTPRLIKTMAMDGELTDVMIDPNQKQAYVKQMNKLTQEVQHIFNPSVGKYEVQAEVGPSYGTRRQEAFNAFSQIAAQNPQLMNVVGDLLFKNADFPDADKIAERLKKMVPAGVLEDGPSAETVQMQQQLQQLQQMLAATIQQLAEEKQKVKAKDQQKDINVYDAITRRLVALEKVYMTPKVAAGMLHDLAVQEHAAGLQQVSAASSPELEQAAQPLEASPQIPLQQ